MDQLGIQLRDQVSVATDLASGLLQLFAADRKVFNKKMKDLQAENTPDSKTQALRLRSSLHQSPAQKCFSLRFLSAAAKLVNEKIYNEQPANKLIEPVLNLLYLSQHFPSEDTVYASKGIETEPFKYAAKLEKDVPGLTYAIMKYYSLLNPKNDPTSFGLGVENFYSWLSKGGNRLQIPAFVCLLEKAPMADWHFVWEWVNEVRDYDEHTATAAEEMCGLTKNYDLRQPEKLPETKEDKKKNRLLFPFKHPDGILKS